MEWETIRELYGQFANSHSLFACHTFFLNECFRFFRMKTLPALLNPLTPQRTVRSSFKDILLLVQGLRTGISRRIRLDYILTQVFM